LGAVNEEEGGLRQGEIQRKKMELLGQRGGRGKKRTWKRGGEGWSPGGRTQLQLYVKESSGKEPFEKKLLISVWKKREGGCAFTKGGEKPQAITEMKKRKVVRAFPKKL